MHHPGNWLRAFRRSWSFLTGHAVSHGDRRRVASDQAGFVRPPGPCARLSSFCYSNNLQSLGDSTRETNPPGRSAYAHFTARGGLGCSLLRH